MRWNHMMVVARVRQTDVRVTTIRNSTRLFSLALSKCILKKRNKSTRLTWWVLQYCSPLSSSLGELSCEFAQSSVWLTEISDFRYRSSKLQLLYLQLTRGWTNTNPFVSAQSLPISTFPTKWANIRFKKNSFRSQSITVPLLLFPG